MKKFKINFKLTAFLVSLFLSIFIVVLGNKFAPCVCIGFILLGVSLALFVLFNDERTTKIVQELTEEINKISEDETMDEDTKMFMKGQLYLTINKLNRRKSKTRIIFYSCGVALIILAIVSVF